MFCPEGLKDTTIFLTCFLSQTPAAHLLYVSAEFLASLVAF
jgi:hypothetical protein